MFRLILLFALAVSAALPAHGQTRTVQNQQDLINWYYAATFGTGVYSAGDRKVAVVQLPISRTLVPVGEDRYGLMLKIPVTFGFYDYSFDDVFVGDLPNQLSTLSVMLGLEWELPLTRRWTLRPYFSGGAGQELSGVDSALIYDFGLKSRFLIAEDKGVEFALVNALTAAGYRPRNAPTQPFGVFAIGLDIMIPTNRVLFGRDALIGFTPIYYYYFNQLKFAKINDADNRHRRRVRACLQCREPQALVAEILRRRPRWASPSAPAMTCSV